MTDPIEKPIAPPNTWKVSIVLTDTPGKRETYLTKEQVINSILYATRVQGLHIVKSEASLIILANDLGRKALNVSDNKEK